MVLYLVIDIVMERIGFEHHLYDYGSAPLAPLSDMNGSGGFLSTD